MAHFESIKINTFRGISHLSVDHLSSVNLIVGDNNCGKTSILEAIQLLGAPNDLNNVFRVSRSRDVYSGLSRMPIFDSFINMLSGTIDKQLSVSCNYQSGNEGELKNAYLSINGSLKRVMFDMNEWKTDHHSEYKEQLLEPDDNEIDEFSGEMTSKIIAKTEATPIQINRFTNVTGRAVETDELIRIQYLSPISHMTSYTFDCIIKNVKYKELCIRMLQIFDEDIEDLLFLTIKSSYRPIEYVRHRKVGLMPLSTYGDGIKKVLSIANAIARSADGVLLIDEIETAIHSKYYDNIFNFVVKAAVQFNVQLFITTHSIEAVDGLLSTQVSHAEYPAADDLIQVITLRKDEISGKTLSRTLSGKEVYDKRETFNFEVRI